MSRWTTVRAIYRTSREDLVRVVRQWYWMFIFITFMSFVAIASGILLVQTIQLKVKIPDAPFVYPRAVYAADKSDYCPGDTLHYTYERIVNDRDFVKVIAETLYRDTGRQDENGNEVYQQAQTFALRGIAVGNFKVSAETSNLLILSPDLLPGNYLLSHVAQGFDTRSTGFSVPFRIMDCVKTPTP